MDNFTIEAYLQYELDHNQKCEYHNGEVFFMSGGTINHGIACGNIYAELRNHLKTKNSNCKAFNSEIKINIESENTFVYPDAFVVCGEVKSPEKDKNSITNPILVVEVLSKSTSNYDRGDKFYKYRQLPSLKEYVLINPDKPIIEIFYRKQPTALWQITRIEGLEKSVLFQSIDCEIPLKELYLDIDFS